MRYAVVDGEGLDGLEVCVKVITQGDVAAVVYAQGGLDEDGGADLAQDALEHLLTVGGEGVPGGIVREVVVVGMHEAPGAKSSVHQVGGKAVIAFSFVYLISAMREFRHDTVG